MKITELDLTEGKRYKANGTNWYVDQTSELISEENGEKLTDEFRFSHVVGFDFKHLPDKLSTEEKLCLAINRIEELVDMYCAASRIEDGYCTCFSYEKGKCVKKYGGCEGCHEAHLEFYKKETLDEWLENL